MQNTEIDILVKEYCLTSLNITGRITSYPSLLREFAMCFRLESDQVNSGFVTIWFSPMQESDSDEDEMRRQWEADKPLSERLKVTLLLS